VPVLGCLPGVVEGGAEGRSSQIRSFLGFLVVVLLAGGWQKMAAATTTSPNKAALGAGGLLLLPDPAHPLAGRGGEGRWAGLGERRQGDAPPSYSSALTSDVGRSPSSLPLGAPSGGATDGRPGLGGSGIKLDGLLLWFDGDASSTLLLASRGGEGEQVLGGEVVGAGEDGAAWRFWAAILRLSRRFPSGGILLTAISGQDGGLAVLLCLRNRSFFNRHGRLSSPSARRITPWLAQVAPSPAPATVAVVRGERIAVVRDSIAFGDNLQGAMSKNEGPRCNFFFFLVFSVMCTHRFVNCSI